MIGSAAEGARARPAAVTAGRVGGEDDLAPTSLIASSGSAERPSEIHLRDARRPDRLDLPGDGGRRSDEREPEHVVGDGSGRLVEPPGGDERAERREFCDNS